MECCNNYGAKFPEQLINDQRLEGPAQCPTGGKRDIRHIIMKFKKLRKKRSLKGQEATKEQESDWHQTPYGDIRSEIIKWHFKDSEATHSVRVWTVKNTFTLTVTSRKLQRAHKIVPFNSFES